MGNILKDKRILAIIILIIICIILSVFSGMNKKNNLNKYFENKNYIFTVDKEKNSKLPYINIDSEEIETINKKFEEKYYNAIYSEYNSSFDYEYTIHDGFLSLLVTEKVINDTEDIPDMVYYAYYIDVQNKKVYSKDDIISKFGLDSTKIEGEINTSLQEQYEYESQEGYIVYQECDFLCYLDLRKYKDLNNNLELYVKDNKVYGYLNLTNKVYYYTKDTYPKYKYLYEL